MHQKAARAAEKTPTVKTVPRVEKQGSELKKRETEVRLALFIAVKCSFRAVDPLGVILNEQYSNTEKPIQLHRTKCEALVKNVIAPQFRHELREDLQRTPSFSILIDEGTDISVKKLCAMVIRFYSPRFGY